jgi:hypothetical protein
MTMMPNSIEYWNWISGDKSSSQITGSKISPKSLYNILYIASNFDKEKILSFYRSQLDSMFDSLSGTLSGLGINESWSGYNSRILMEFGPGMNTRSASSFAAPGSLGPSESSTKFIPPKEFSALGKGISESDLRSKVASYFRNIAISGLVRKFGDGDAWLAKCYSNQVQLNRIDPKLFFNSTALSDDFILGDETTGEPINISNENLFLNPAFYEKIKEFANTL